LTERQIMDCLAIPNPHETEHWKNNKKKDCTKLC